MKLAQRYKSFIHHLKDKKIEKLCVKCGNNPAWLDYAFCYDCYLKQIEENKEKINNHWHGGTGETLY